MMPNDFSYLRQRPRMSQNSALPLSFSHGNLKIWMRLLVRLFFSYIPLKLKSSLAEVLHSSKHCSDSGIFLFFFFFYYMCPSTGSCLAFLQQLYNGLVSFLKKCKKLSRPWDKNVQSWGFGHLNINTTGCTQTIQNPFTGLAESKEKHFSQYCYQLSLLCPKGKLMPLDLSCSKENWSLSASNRNQECLPCIDVSYVVV